MNKFTINLVGPEALQINFLKPYSEDIVRQIQLVLESMGATITTTLMSMSIIVGINRNRVLLHSRIIGVTIRSMRRVIIC